MSDQTKRGSESPRRYKRTKVQREKTSRANKKAWARRHRNGTATFPGKLTPYDPAEFADEKGGHD